MKAPIFTGWIYNHLLPHAARVKAAHPVMLRAIAASKKKNDRIDPARSRTAYAVTSCPNPIWSPPRFGIGAAHCGTGL